MSKTIFIGGRLESKEKGNVIAGANAILDDTKGKKQNVINKETDDELLRLEQSKQDNLTFDNAPTEDSTNPVTSGGVYTAEKALSDAIEAILLLIPSAATALNKLVDTNTMNSSISTATATFRGTYNAVSDLGLTYQATHAQIEAALDALGLTADNNDYVFVQVPVSDQSQDIAKTERYKNNGTNWQYEYDLNASGFTAAQWAAINSGITVALVTKLTDLPTAAALQLALNAKQDTLTFDSEPTALSLNPVTSGGIYTAIQAIATALSDYSTTTDGRLDVLEGLIPSEAASNNKLTDKAYVDGLIQAITELIPAEATTSNQLADKAYVLASILAATPAFKGQFTTLAELQAVASPKDGDLGIVRTKDSDGMDVFTVYQYLNNAWDVFYSLSYHPQTKPATTGTTGDYPYNGMGRVELAKNMVNTGTELAPVYENQLTQDMFYKGAVGSRTPNANTIFVIRYDYVLAENITIPDGCVLEFEGGSISGAYTLTLNKTHIQGNAQFDCTLAGDVANELFNVLWMKGSDLGEQINKAGANFKSLIVPQGEYVYTTPVVLSGIRQLLSYAVLKYNGDWKNNEGVFLVVGIASGYIYFNSLMPNEPSSVNHADDRTINAIGLEIRNCTNSKLIVNSIGYFNENLRLSGYGAECCDNTWFLGSLYNGNFNIRIYQQGGGYCNENTFIGGHLAHYGSSMVYGRKYYIGIGGPAIDFDSYLPTKPADSSDSINMLKFIDMDLESDTPVFLARNATHIAFLRDRFEGQSVKSKVYGEFSVIFEDLYNSIFNLIDVSEADRNYCYIPIKGYDEKIVVDNTVKGFNGVNVPYNMYIATPLEISTQPRTNYNTNLGCIVNTTTHKLIHVKSEKNENFNVYYLDDNNQNITPNYNTQQYSPGGGSFFSALPSGWGSWSCSSGNDKIFYIPDGINKVFIGVEAKDNNSNFVITTLANGLVSVNTLPITGTTANRPVGLPATVPYFDTSLGKPIWYNGSGWVDATGATV